MSDSIARFTNASAADARDQADHIASDLFGGAHSQGVLTLIVRTNTREMKARQKQIGKRFPGGADAYSLHVHEFDPIIGPKKAGTGARDFSWGFSSLNGLPFGQAKTIEELEDGYWFIGFSRSNHYTIPDLAKGRQIDKQGFSVITFGICSMRQHHKTDIYPGDKLMWSFPSVKEAKVSMTRKTTTRHPTDKLMVNIGPLDWSYLKYALNNVCKLLLRSANDIGISHKLGMNVGDYGKGSTDGSANVRTARALKYHALTTVALGVETLAMRGLVEIQTPYKKKKKQTMVVLLREALNFAKSKLPNNVAVTAAPMDFAGTKVPGLDALNESRANDEQGKFLRAYIEFSNACHEQETNAATLTNVEFEDEFLQPYTYFTQNKDWLKQMNAKQLPIPPVTSESQAKAAVTKAKMDKVNDILFVTNYLGLTNGGKGEKTRVTHDVLNATHISFGDPESSIKYLTGSPLNQDLAIFASEKQLLLLNQYKQLAEEHLLKLNEEMARLAQTIRDREIGTAVSHATAGSLDTILDVLVKA